MAARFERRLALQRLLDLLLHAVQLEHAAQLAVQLDARQRLGHEGRGKLAHVAVRVRLVDDHTVDVRAQQIAQHPQVQRQVGVHQAARLGAQPPLAHHLPELSQVDHIGVQRLWGRVLGRGAHDVAGVAVLLREGLHRGAQALAFRLVLDAR